MLSAALAQLANLKMSISLPSLVAYGFGQTREHSIVSNYGLGIHGSGGRAWQVVFANSYQVMVSFLYLVYNNILTRQVLADEMMRFLRYKKALRVSSPENVLQRSSYSLSLPWKYAVPQILGFTLLHWLVSQSVFTVQTEVYGAGPKGSHKERLDGARIGFSAIGIVSATTWGAILAILLILNSIRPYKIAVPQNFPRMASNSAAIAANCHRPPGDGDAYLFPVQLGVVTHEPTFGHTPACRGRITFSSDADISFPIGNESYELAQWNEKEAVGFTGRVKGMLRSVRRSREVDA